MAIFNSYVTNYQRVTPSISHDWWWTPPDSHDLSQLSFGTSTGIPLATSSRCFTACACRHWLYYQIVSLIVISTYRPIYLPIYLTMIIYIYIYYYIYIIIIVIIIIIIIITIIIIIYTRIYYYIYTYILLYIYMYQSSQPIRFHFRPSHSAHALVQLRWQSATSEVHPSVETL